MLALSLVIVLKKLQVILKALIYRAYKVMLYNKIVKIQWIIMQILLFFLMEIIRKQWLYMKKNRKKNNHYNSNKRLFIENCIFKYEGEKKKW